MFTTNRFGAIETGGTKVICRWAIRGGKGREQSFTSAACADKLGFLFPCVVKSTLKHGGMPKAIGLSGFSATFEFVQSRCGKTVSAPLSDRSASRRPSSSLARDYIHMTALPLLRRIRRGGIASLALCHVSKIRDKANHILSGFVSHPEILEPLSEIIEPLHNGQRASQKGFKALVLP